MSDALRKSLTHSAKVALDEGAFALVRSLLDALEGVCEVSTPEPEPVSVSAKGTSTERVRAFRMKRRNGPTSVSSGVSETGCNGVSSSLPPSPSPSSLSQDSSGSSSLSSSLPEQGSSLKRRASETGNAVSFSVPECFDVPETLAVTCEMRFGRRPLQADVAAFCGNERKRIANGMEPRFRSLAALHEGLKGWMNNQRGIDEKSRHAARSSGKPVQPSDPHAPWMQDGYGALTEDKPQ